MASVLAFMAVVMVSREALRSVVQGEADGGLVVVVAAADGGDVVRVVGGWLVLVQEVGDSG
jgi:hypothetical protein